MQHVSCNSTCVDNDHDVFVSNKFSNLTCVSSKNRSSLLITESDGCQLSKNVYIIEGLVGYYCTIVSQEVSIASRACTR